MAKKPAQKKSKVVNKPKQSKWVFLTVIIFAIVGVVVLGFARAASPHDSNEYRAPGPTVAASTNKNGPSAPSDLAYTLDFDWKLLKYTVTLTWGASTDTDGVAGYEVTQSGKDTLFTKDLSFTEDSIGQNSTQTFTVIAVDTLGNKGDAVSIDVTSSCYFIWCNAN